MGGDGKRQAHQKEAPAPPPQRGAWGGMVVSALSSCVMILLCEASGAEAQGRRGAGAQGLSLRGGAPAVGHGVHGRHPHRLRSIRSPPISVTPPLSRFSHSQLPKRSSRLTLTVGLPSKVGRVQYKHCNVTLQIRRLGFNFTIC
jgi:hypothetical protein